MTRACAIMWCRLGAQLIRHETLVTRKRLTRLPIGAELGEEIVEPLLELLLKVTKWPARQAAIIP